MDTYTNTLFIWTGISIIAFLVLLFKSAPYGRYSMSSWGPSMSSRLGWILMESPTVYLMLLFMYFFSSSLGVVEIIFTVIWMVHYVHRSFIWPLRAKLEGKRITLIVVLLAVIFNLVNVYIQGSWIFIYGSYEKGWFFLFFFDNDFKFFYFLSRMDNAQYKRFIVIIDDWNFRGFS